jgi:hypothetical protein
LIAVLEHTKITTRLPEPYTDWLRVEAARNGSSMNSEIIRAVRERMERCRAASLNDGVRPPARDGDGNDARNLP